ncbi:MAG: anthranilate phosphoribosyltransferase [Pseudomonadota bacterium]|nr:anthranilate phosphoribosyltransferase [Pseudomonadota bacterium]MDE3038302.1 anthranilate phosphoribosyltransferase [Pseudomonadota bacterium]
MTDTAFSPILTLLADGKNLPRDMAVRAFQIIMNGGATPAQMGAFLMALRLKGETVDEIAGGATAMRAKAQPFKAPPGAIDTCGTGGDERHTYNISTAVAFVLTACGMKVAKHGNRSVSSKSGSADVLAALGVNINAEPKVLERCLAECNICFLLAPKFHPAMRHVAPVRQELGVRTIFNLLGPLSNPAAPDFQLLGVYADAWGEPLAHALKELGTKAAWVVHGSDGMDELTLSGASMVAELKDGNVRRFEVTPEEAGLARAPLEDLKGKTPEHNAGKLLEAISGVESAYRNAVVYNAAAGLIIAGKAADLKEGAAMAKDAIDSGKAHAILKKLADVSNAR